MAQSQLQDSHDTTTSSSAAAAAVPSDAPASPVAAATSLNQESTGDRGEAAMEEESGDSDSRKVPENESEVRRVPECEEDDDVIIPLPDDARGSNARDGMEMETES